MIPFFGRGRKLEPLEANISHLSRQEKSKHSSSIMHESTLIYLSGNNLKVFLFLNQKPLKEHVSFFWPDIYDPTSTTTETSGLANFERRNVVHQSDNVDTNKRWSSNAKDLCFCWDFLFIYLFLDHKILLVPWAKLNRNGILNSDLPQTWLAYV